MKSTIQISEIIYFGEMQGEKFNAKVRYTKKDKSYVACVYLDYFWKEVYFPKQPKYFKVLHGLDYAIKLQKKFI
jgi:hypothetical protein